MFKLIRKCLFSPELYRIYGQAPDVPDTYVPFTTEKLANKIISAAKTALSVSGYTAPFISMYVYKRGFFSWLEVQALFFTFATVGAIVGLAYFMRAFARASNPRYMEFLETLNRKGDDIEAYLERIRKYDFEFYAWPSSYRMDPDPSLTWMEKSPFNKCANQDLPHYQQVIIQILSYVAVQTFALRLVYPGTLSIVQNMLWSTLAEGRSNIVNFFNGKRAKIITADGNDIDTMFVSNRLDSPKGNILVICSEGNSGFYEIGILNIPIKAGYSALGWNHPGFAGSTGTPFPKQEQNAIDAVIQYAINELEFQPEQIVLFGWSIGGYASSWAAANYPEMKGVILDACFDDVMPLAENQMPKSWSLLVKEVIRSYLNLNVAELLSEYPGPIQLIRRTEDEVICVKPNLIITNRGNYILMSILEQRHPEFFKQFESEENVKETVEAFIALTDQQRIVISRTDLPPIKRALMPLIAKYMCDFRSTHCTPLPDDIFAAVMDPIINPQ